MAGAVSSLQWLQTEAGSVHHFNAARFLDRNTEQASPEGAASNDPNEFVWRDRAVADLQQELWNIHDFIHV